MPLREFFNLRHGVLLSEEEFNSLEAGSSSFDFYGAHLQAREMHKLRTMNFTAHYGSASAMVVHCNGAVWYVCFTLSCRCAVMFALATAIQGN